MCHAKDRRVIARKKIKEYYDWTQNHPRGCLKEGAGDAVTYSYNRVEVPPGDAAGKFAESTSICKRAKYVLGTAKTDAAAGACPDGYSPVMESKEACQAAAGCLNVEDANAYNTGALNADNHKINPIGCYRDIFEKGHWNAVVDGITLEQIRNGDAPLCIVDAPAAATAPAAAAAPAAAGWLR